MPKEKSVEAILDEAAEARAQEAGVSKAPADDEGDSATPADGGDAADTADDDEGEEQQALEVEDQDDSGEEEEAAKPKPPSRAQKRIRKLTRERDERDRQLAQRDAEIRVLMQQLERQGQTAKPNGQAQEDAQPKQDDYQDYAQFIADTAAWAARQETRRTLQAQGKASAKRAAEVKSVEEHNARVSRRDQVFSKGEDTFEDFADTVGDENLPISDPMTDYLLEGDNGHAVLYHLGKNPDEAKRIYDLSTPAAQMKAMAILEAKIAKPVAKKRTTRASEPIKPVKAGGAPGGFDPDTCSMKEYMADYNRKRAAGEL